MFGQIVFYIGRLLQILGLSIVPVALIIGLESHDATTELKYLMVGAGVFVVGTLLLKFGGEQA